METPMEEVSQLAAGLSERVLAAQRAFAEAEREQDHYAMDVRSGELKSLRRLAAEHGVTVPAAESGAEA
ncbi:hypothetical protein [Kribbella sp. NPDC051620]|uniref:hypothetical protein n=1 Tax=Kribbella sp. NPDC051620 TaxID=3364120 RepID=UPI0037A971F1